jgi:hypothetical protein
MLALGPFAHRRRRTKVRRWIEVAEYGDLLSAARNATPMFVTETLGVLGSSPSMTVNFDSDSVVSWHPGPRHGSLSGPLRGRRGADLAGLAARK